MPFEHRESCGKVNKKCPSTDATSSTHRETHGCREHSASSRTSFRPGNYRCLQTRSLNRKKVLHTTFVFLPVSFADSEGLFFRCNGKKYNVRKGDLTLWRVCKYIYIFGKDGIPWRCPYMHILKVLLYADCLCVCTHRIYATGRDAIGLVSSVFCFMLPIFASFHGSALSVGACGAPVVHLWSRSWSYIV